MGILLVVVLLANVVPVVVGFRPNAIPLTTTISRRRLFLRHGSSLHAQQQQQQDDRTEVTQRKGRVNERVRAIMQVLTSSGPTDEPTSHQQYDIKEWSKTRNYIYNRQDLTVEQAKKVLDFLNQVFAEDEQLVTSIVQSTPRILRKNVQSFLKPTSDFLQDLYGMEMLQEAVRRNPSILLSRGVGYDSSKDTSDIEDLLLSFLELKPSSVDKLKKKAPWLFQRPAGRIQQVIEFWRDLLQQAGKRPNQADTIIGKLIMLYPTLFNLSVNDNLIPRVDFLRDQCGLSKEDVASLLTGSRASIFGLSIEKNLRPSIQCLKDLLPGKDETIQKEIIRKCILSHPQILGLSLDNLQSKKTYFDAIDDLGRERGDSLACRILVRCPAVLSLSLKENIIPTVEALAGVWGKQAPRVNWVGGKFQISNEDIPKEVVPDAKGSLSSLLGEYPSILSLSLEGNIQPTLTFYNKTGFVLLDSHWKAPANSSSYNSIGTSQVPVLRGRYIASSLFQRLLPRWHFFLAHREQFWKKRQEENGDENNNGNGDTELMMKSPPLHLLSVADDKTYCQHLGVALEDYKLFKEESIPRLKFSSQFDTWLKTGRPIDV